MFKLVETGECAFHFLEADDVLSIFFGLPCKRGNIDIIDRVKHPNSDLEVNWVAPARNNKTEVTKLNENIYHTLGCAPFQQYIVTRIMTFLGNPNLNLHLPLAYWEGGPTKKPYIIRIGR